jgi:hypothetical protein
MVATMSSSSWHHCSTADSEACQGAGLWRSWRVVTNVALANATSGGITTMVAERCRYAAGAVWTTVVPTTQLPTRQDRPALEREVASPSVPCSRREG